MFFKYPIKILYFITELDIGGAEQLLLYTLKNLNKQKFLPTVCCFYKGKLTDEIENLGINVIHLKIKNKFDMRSVFRFYNFLRRERFDILHTHLFHANIIGRVIGRLCKVPIIVSTQHYTFSYNGIFGILLEKLTKGLSDRIIAVSEAARRFYINEIGIPESKLVLIHNGIDLDMLNRQSYQRPSLKEELYLNNDFIIGCIGSFTEVKGHIYLLRAIKELIETYNKIELLLIGSGVLEKYLRKITRELGISDNVIFLNKRRDIPYIMASFDLYVMPSLQEGLSIILLEAMAMGKPCIATAVGGNPEVIINGESGILVPSSDPQALADAILALLKDKEKARLLGINGRKRVAERFDIKDNVRKTETLYEELIEERV